MILLVLILAFAATSSAVSVALQLGALVIAYVVVLGRLVNSRVQLHSFAVAFLVFSGAAALSATASAVPASSLVKGLSLGALVLVAALVVTPCATTRASLKSTAMSLYVWFPAAVAATALTGLALNRSKSLVAYEAGFNRLTIPYFNTHPNTLGTICAIGIFAVAYRWWHGERSAIRVAILTAEVAVLALTYSRSAVIDLLVAAMVLAMITRRQIRTLLIVAAPTIVLLAVFGDKLLEVALRTQSVEQILELSGRLRLWNAGYQAWLAHPLLGTGYAIGATSAIAASGLYLAYDVSTTDNVLLDALLETGAIGGGAILMAYLIAVRSVWRIRRQRGLGINVPTPVNEAVVVSMMVMFHAVGAGGVGRFHVLLVMLVASMTLVQDWLQNQPSLNSDSQSKVPDTLSLFVRHGRQL